MEQKWKVGDWCFKEFEVCEIQEVEDGRVVQLSTGFINSGTYDFNDRIFPLTLRGKQISEEFSYFKKKLQGHKRSNHLNWPDIERWFENLWCDTMENQDKDEEIKLSYKELADFCDQIIKEADKSVVVDGVKVFR